MNYNETKNGEARSALPRLVKGTLNHEDEKKTQSVQSLEGEISSLGEVYNLVEDSRPSGSALYLNVKTFPNNEVEIVGLKLTSDDALRNGGGAVRRNKTKTEMTPETLKKSQLRAKKIIRHKLMMMQSDRMLTLTYRENQTDIKQAWKDLKAFSRLMKWRYNDAWQYVCVPEYQKRGAVHFHLAIKGYYHANTVRRLWLKVVGENNGNIDITSPRVIDKKSWNPKRIANYLAKYVTKSESVDFNQKRYSSTNIELPPSVSGWMALGIPVFWAMHKLLSGLTTKNYEDYWEADGYFPIYMMTT